MTRADALPLVPYPLEVAGVDDVRFTGTSRIVAGEALHSEAAVLAATIESRTGLVLEVIEGVTPRPGDIVLEVGAIAEHPESYQLDTSSGAAVIVAPSDAGIFWGTTTLRQLLAHDEAGWFIIGATVHDTPRFDYRGVMLDVARHFFGVDDVKRYIDAMSAFKFNVLHLHLTDDQGWRLASATYPLLTEKASATSALGDEGGFYTAADYQEIIRYAASRHMTVVPEIDTPGHTHAVTVAYPEFTLDTTIMPSVVDTAEAFGQALPVHGHNYTGWGVGFSSLKTDDRATNEFVATIFAELAAQTPGPYLHLGGDESLGIDDAQFAQFVAMATRAVQATGKKAIMWHEAGKTPDFAPGTIGQYWGFVDPQPGYADEARAFVDKGGSLIMSPADVSYLDMKPADDHPLGLVWAKGATSVEAAYTWEPTAIIDGVSPEAIFGVEAPLWSETARTMTDVFTLALPRACAVAEIAWSAADGPERTWESFRHRVAHQAQAWQADDIAFYAAEEIAW